MAFIKRKCGLTEKVPVIISSFEERIVTALIGHSLVSDYGATVEQALTGLSTQLRSFADTLDLVLPAPLDILASFADDFWCGVKNAPSVHLRLLAEAVDLVREQQPDDGDIQIELFCGECGYRVVKACEKHADADVRTLFRVVRACTN